MRQLYGVKTWGEENKSSNENRKSHQGKSKLKKKKINK
jgi:hypothetical protein